MEVRHDGVSAVLHRGHRWSEELRLALLAVLAFSALSIMISVLTVVGWKAGFAAGQGVLRPPVMPPMAMLTVILATLATFYAGILVYAFAMVTRAWVTVHVASNAVAVVAVHAWRGLRFRTDEIRLSEVIFCRMTDDSVVVGTPDRLYEWPADASPFRAELADYLHEQARARHGLPDYEVGPVPTELRVLLGTGTDDGS